MLDLTCSVAAAQCLTSTTCVTTGIVITDHDGAVSPYRAALRRIFEGLARADSSKAGQLQQFRLPIFATGQNTFNAIKVCTPCFQRAVHELSAAISRVAVILEARTVMGMCYQQAGFAFGGC